jgi:hypothetical protein
VDLPRRGVIVPAVLYVVAGRIARDLRRTEQHPLRGWSGTVVQRTPEGGFASADAEADAAPEPAPPR